MSQRWMLALVFGVFALGCREPNLPPEQPSQPMPENPPDPITSTSESDRPPALGEADGEEEPTPEPEVSPSPR